MDAAIHEIISHADVKAYTILKERSHILDNLAEVLLDMEKITGTQFEAIYNGKTLADFKAEQISNADRQEEEQQDASGQDTAEAKETNE